MDTSDKEVKPMSYWLYILRCGDGTLYTGVTTDVEKRLAAHRGGKGAKYTRGRGPLTVVYREECGDKSAALRRELAVKALSRQEKLALIGTEYPALGGKKGPVSAEDEFT